MTSEPSPFATATIGWRACCSVAQPDHGEMLGEHGVWGKRKFFEGSVRVPLLIRWPARFVPRVVDANVNLCDLFATLCELTGLPGPNQPKGLFDLRADPPERSSRIDLPEYADALQAFRERRDELWLCSVTRPDGAADMCDAITRIR